MCVYTTTLKLQPLLIETCLLEQLEHLLYQNESVKGVFNPPSMVSYDNARKLSRYLVRAKLCPLERKRGSYKCGDSICLVCNSIEETDASTAAEELFKINHHVCYNYKYLICFLTCTVCKKQYTEETVDRFRLTWNNYKESDRKFLKGKRLNKNLCMNNFWLMAIKALKKMLVSI